jgi:hypothetical protein
MEYKSLFSGDNHAFLRERARARPETAILPTQQPEAPFF